MAPIHTSDLIHAIFSRPLDGVELSPTLLGQARLTDQLEDWLDAEAEPFEPNPEDMDTSCVFL